MVTYVCLCCIKTATLHMFKDSQTEALNLNSSCHQNAHLCAQIKNSPDTTAFLK